jgi:hypothetical protein
MGLNSYTGSGDFPDKPMDLENLPDDLEKIIDYGNGIGQGPLTDQRGSYFRG